MTAIEAVVVGLRGHSCKRRGTMVVLILIGGRGVVHDVGRGTSCGIRPVFSLVHILTRRSTTCLQAVRVGSQFSTLVSETSYRCVCRYLFKGAASASQLFPARSTAMIAGGISTLSPPAVQRAVFSLRSRAQSDRVGGMSHQTAVRSGQTSFAQGSDRPPGPRPHACYCHGCALCVAIRTIQEGGNEILQDWRWYAKDRRLEEWKSGRFRNNGESNPGGWVWSGRRWRCRLRWEISAETALL